MAISGTAAHAALAGFDDLPPSVRAAVRLAQDSGFEQSCLPEHGELLRVLARGIGAGTIGETGTGCGVGLAWLASGAQPDARLVSVEVDQDRANRTAELFHDLPQVRVLPGDWRTLREYGPFDLLVLDGGGQGKGSGPGAEALDPAEWLNPGGLIVMDDFAPLDVWPPLFQGAVDVARTHWLEHPQLRATQVRVTPQWATLLATFTG